MTSTLSTSEVLYLKLHSGVDLMGTVVEENNKQITITNPIQIQRVISPMSSGIQIGMMPWVPILELMPLKYSLVKTQIAAMVDIPQDSKLVEEYKSLIVKYNQDYDGMEEVTSGDFTDEEDEFEEPIVANEPKKRVIN